MFYYFWMTFFYIPLWFIYPTRIIGKKNIPKKGRFIFSANHQTLNDPIIVAHKVYPKRRFRFMAKAPLFKYKIGGAILKALGAYPVHNATGDIKAIKTTMFHLKKERGVLIFPEGARLQSSESNELKDGVAMFSLKTKTPIIPAYFVKKTIAFRFNKLLVGEPLKLYEMEEFKDKKIDKELLKNASKVLSVAINSLNKNYLKAKNDKTRKKIKKKQVKSLLKQKN